MTTGFGARRAVVIATLAMAQPDVVGAQSLRGIAFDSLLTGRPFAGAEIWSPTLGRTVIADSSGRFAFDSVSVGRADTIEVAVYHPLLELMAIPAPTIRVPSAAVGGEPIVVGVPSADALRRLLCGAGADPDAVLAIGRVVGVPPDADAARVEAQWQDLIVDRTTIERRTRSVSGVIRGSKYWLCGAPAGTPFVIAAQTRDGPPTIVRVGPTREPVVVRHLALVSASDSASAATGVRLAISSRVVSRSGAPINNAEVTIGGTDTRTRTGSEGQFAISFETVGRRELNVRAVGYEPAALSLYVTPRQRELPAIVLERTVQVLAERAVTASAAGLRGFEYRRKTGIGYYLTREQIEKRHAPTTADLFTGIPNVWVQPSGTVAIRRSEGQIGLKFPGGCLPLYYIDGMPVNLAMPMFGAGVKPPDLGPNQFVVPSEIEGIEVYRGLGSIPPEFKPFDAGCGVIVIWTRRGLDARDHKPGTPP